MKRSLLIACIVGLICTLAAQGQYVFKAGTTSQSINVFIVDNAQTGTLSGGGITGLAFNTSSLTAYYKRDGGSSTAITLATLSNATSAFSSGGFIAVDGTNMPGVYRLDIPDAALAASAKYVVINIKGAANMAPVTSLIRLTTTDDQDAVRGGMTALPNANAAASGGLLINGSNTAAAITAGSLTLTGLIDSGTFNVAGIVNSGSFSNTGTLSAGTFTITNGITAATLSTSGAATLNSLSVTNSLGAGSLAITNGLTAGSLAVTNGFTSGTMSTGTATIGTLNVTNGIGAASLAVTNGLTVGTFSSGTFTFGTLALSNASSLAGLTVGTATNVTNGVTVTTNNDKTGYRLSATGVDDVWDELLSGHAISGSTGAGLSAASSAGDPWATALPGAYGAGTAGKIIGDNINATISSRLASSAITLSGGAVTVGTNNDKTGYSLTQAFPTNFSALGINASGHISRVTLADTITTYTGDTPQTGNVYPLVDTEVAAIKTKTDFLPSATAGSAGGVFISGANTTTSLNGSNIATVEQTQEIRDDIAALPDATTVTTALDAIKTKTDFLPSATAGAAGGVLIAGSNAATTFATLTSTGAFTINGTANVAQTGDSYGRIGATGSGLTSLAPSSTALSTANWTNGRAALLDHLDVDISTRLPTATNATSIATIKTNTDALGTAMELDGLVYRFTINALEQAPAGGGGGGGFTADDRTLLGKIGAKQGVRVP